jgi:23S rRNA pseudouridine1911/1915/1917 synthase
VTAEPVEIRTFTADRGDARLRRLDLVVLRRLGGGVPGVSRSRVQEWIASGRVEVGGTAVLRSARRIGQGEAVTVVVPAPLPPRPAPVAEERPLAILYEDEHFLALDKPAGWVVHPTPRRREGTLLNALLFRAATWPGDNPRPGLVSRLDRDTSGVVLVAKRPGVHAALARALRSPHAAKDYLALVYGATASAKGRIDLAIARDPADPRRRIAGKDEGQPSSTLYERIGVAGGLSLLRCRLLTGRTHQIRVHLQAIGHPIVGDPFYGEPRHKGLGDQRLAALCRDFERQALHAWSLLFPHPASGEAMQIVAPVPDDFAGLVAAAGLRWP